MVSPKKSLAARIGENLAYASIACGIVLIAIAFFYAYKAYEIWGPVALVFWIWMVLKVGKSINGKI